MFQSDIYDMGITPTTTSTTTTIFSMVQILPSVSLLTEMFQGCSDFAEIQSSSPLQVHRVIHTYPATESTSIHIVSFAEVLLPMQVGPVCIAFRLPSPMEGGQMHVIFPSMFSLPDPGGLHQQQGALMVWRKDRKVFDIV